MKPIIRFSSDNATLHTALDERFISAVVTDQKGITSDTLELELDDGDNRLEMPRKGIHITVSVGYAETALKSLGAFIVDETGAAGGAGEVDKLIVRARATNLRDTIKAPKTRSFDDITVGDLVKKIAAEQGLKARVSKKYLLHPLPHVAQTGESDLHLLTRHAQALGAIAKPVGEYLLFVEQGTGNSATGKALAPVTIHKSQCSSWSVTLPDRDKYNAVVARWHDVTTGDNRSLEIGRGTPVFELPTIYASEVAARTAAETKYNGLKRSTAELNLTLDGDGSYQAEALLHAVGFREGVTGEWVIAQVQHRIGASAYSCQIRATRGSEKTESEA